MRINRLTIQNYRSFADEVAIEFPNIAKPIAIIGHNNAGKSNLIDALLMAMGKKSVYGNNFSKNDFFNHNINEDIIIRAKITDDDCLIQADAFNKTQTIDSIKLIISCEDGFCDSNHILCDNNGKQIRLSQSIPQSKKNDYSDEEKKAFKERRTDGLLYFTKIKNKIPLYFIDPTNIQDELSPKKNSILADVMKKVKASFEKDRFPKDFPKETWQGKTRKDIFNNYLKFVENNVLKTKELDELVECITEEIMSQLGLDSDNFDLSLSIPDIDVFYKNLDFLLKDNDDPQKPKLPICNYGRGFSLLFIVALLKILSKSKDGGKIFVIEEPETFLHEHYQEYFYQVLCELAKNNQVIYTTHSKKFIDLFDPKTIIKLDNQGYKHTEVIQNKDEFITYPKDYAKYITSIEPNLGNLIFSDKVLIVEGSHDILTYKMVFNDVNFGLKNISIVAAFGKDGIINLINLCKLYKIDYFAIHDWDIEKEDIDVSIEPDGSSDYASLTKEEKAQYTKNHKLLITAAGTDKIHQNKKRLEEVLGISQADKGCEAIYEKLKDLSREEIQKQYPKLIDENLLNFLEFK